MNKKYITLLLYIIFIIQINAERIKGKIFYDKDTSDVIFDFNTSKETGKIEIDYSELQNSIDYDSLGIGKILTPNKANGYQFEIEGKQIIMLAVPNTIEDVDYSKPIPKIFLKLEIDGKLRLFKYYETKLKDPYSPIFANTLADLIVYIASKDYYIKETIWLKKENQTITKFVKNTFKRSGASYFKDCPYLSEGIKNKDYKLENLVAIVQYYNTNCGK
jgi:hypothetical protein